jgi:sulfate permease, SulP family
MGSLLRPDRWRFDYSWAFLRRDLIAGLTVAAVAVPQAMAYALIAGVDPKYGLYTAIVMTALGSVFGSSAHLINGPTNAISVVVFSAVDGLTNGPDDPNRIALVGLLAVLVGLLQVTIALLKLGDLTRYISESVILGFLAGAGVLVALGQIHNLLGLRAVGHGDQLFIWRLWLTLRDGGSVHWPALAVGVATLLLVNTLHRVGRRLGVRLPELLIALTVVSSAVWLLGITAGPRGDAPLVVARTLPAFQPPPLREEWVRHLWGGALSIALLGLIEALAIAKAIAARTRQPLDYNRQCLAEGLANLGGGLFQCLPGSGSLTRSAINYQAGAATRLSGVFSAAAVAATLLLFAPLAQYVPRPALAGVLLWTAWRIVDRRRLAFCLRATRFDAGLALSTAFVAVFLSIEFSILIGTFLSFLFFVPRAARLTVTELVVAADRVVRERRPEDPVCSRMVLFSVEGELFFGAASDLDELLADLVRRVEQGTRIVVLRFKRARNPDMVCLERLHHFLTTVHARKGTVLFCGVREDFARVLRNVRFHEVLPADCLFLEDGAKEPSTLLAVRRAYELIGTDRCPGCPRPLEPEADRGGWYYMI